MTEKCRVSKKHRKRLKELQRLQALHQDAAQDNVSHSDAGGAEQSSENFRVETPVQTVVTPSSLETSEPVAPVVVHEHSHVKKDLVFLVVLIVVMIAVLVALNWTIDNTGFGDWLLALFGQ